MQRDFAQGRFRRGRFKQGRFKQSHQASPSSSPSQPERRAHPARRHTPDASGLRSMTSIVCARTSPANRGRGSVDSRTLRWTTRPRHRAPRRICRTRVHPPAGGQGNHEGQGRIGGCSAGVAGGDGRSCTAEVDHGTAELVGDPDRPQGWTLMRRRHRAVARRPGRSRRTSSSSTSAGSAHVADLAAPPTAPLRALHLGGGAWTLARYVAATRPGSPQRVVELDAALVDLVSSRLPADGHGHRGRRRRRAGRARPVPPGSVDLRRSRRVRRRAHPAHLTSVEFVRAAAAVLAPGGVYAANVADGGPLAFARAQVAAAAAVFAERRACVAVPELLRGRRFGNLVLVGGGRTLPRGRAGAARWRATRSRPACSPAPRSAGSPRRRGARRRSTRRPRCPRRASSAGPRTESESPKCRVRRRRSARAAARWPGARPGVSAKQDVPSVWQRTKYSQGPGSGCQRRGDRLPARGGDRRRRQPGDHVAVVRPRPRPVLRRGAQCLQVERVVDRRVELEPAAGDQPVVDHPGDLGHVRRDPLLLHQRGDDQHLVRGGADALRAADDTGRLEPFGRGGRAGRAGRRRRSHRAARRSGPARAGPRAAGRGSAARDAVQAHSGTPSSAGSVSAHRGSQLVGRDAALHAVQPGAGGLRDQGEHARRDRAVGAAGVVELHAAADLQLPDPEAGSSSSATAAAPDICAAHLVVARLHRADPFSSSSAASVNASRWPPRRC